MRFKFSRLDNLSRGHVMCQCKADTHCEPGTLVVMPPPIPDSQVPLIYGFIASGASQLDQPLRRWLSPSIATKCRVPGRLVASGARLSDAEMGPSDCERRPRLQLGWAHLPFDVHRASFRGIGRLEEVSEIVRNSLGSHK